MRAPMKWVRMGELPFGRMAYLTLSSYFSKLLTFSRILGKLSTSETFMSDGPHRSLPMGRRWKKLAECLDNASFSVDDLCERRDSAIIGEFKREVPESRFRNSR